MTYNLFYFYYTIKSSKKKTQKYTGECYSEHFNQICMTSLFCSTTVALVLYLGLHGENVAKTAFEAYTPLITENPKALG